jgi:hypothetical protein
MTNSKPQSRSKLLNLPGEIRNLIWRAVVPATVAYRCLAGRPVRNGSSTGWEDGSFPLIEPLPHLGLIVACHQTHDEASIFPPSTTIELRLRALARFFAQNTLDAPRHASTSAFRIPTLQRNQFPTSAHARALQHNLSNRVFSSRCSSNEWSLQLRAVSRGLPLDLCAMIKYDVAVGRHRPHARIALDPETAMDLLEQERLHIDAMRAQMSQEDLRVLREPTSYPTDTEPCHQHW